MQIYTIKLSSLLITIKGKFSERDKQQHFWYSFSILTVLLFLFDSALTSTVITLAIGLAKEIWDQYYGSGFCWFDMAANLTGVVAALLSLAILHFFDFPLISLLG